SQATSQSFSITVQASLLSITTVPPLSAGTVGTPYSQTLAATGGTPPYSWSLVSGTFPVGLSLSAAGVISGSPATPRPRSFTVQVTDSGSQTALRSLSIAISLPTPSITTASPLPAATVGASYSQTLAATGGTPPYSWSVVAGTLAQGLTLSTTGVISG